MKWPTARLKAWTTGEREHLKALQREVKELRRANGILKTAGGFFAQTEVAAHGEASDRKQRGRPVRVHACMGARVHVRAWRADAEPG